MSNRQLDLPSTTYARMAGVLYLLIAVIAAFSIGYVPSTLIVAGDAATTIGNLSSNSGLFAAGLAGDVAIMLIEIALSVMLYMLTRPVSPTLALIAMIGRLAEVMVMAINILIHTMVILTLRQAGGDSLAPQAQALVMALVDAHAYGIYVWDILFGFSLAFLGYLVARSGYFPRILGWGMTAGSLGYLAEGLSKVTHIESEPMSLAIVALLVVATVAELAFALWLLVRGTGTSTRSSPAATTA